MIRALLIFCTLSIFLSACTQRVVCPAYQSAFIYDKDALRQKFSYFNQDSTPKVLTASSKNKYLVIEPVSYKKKIRSMQTVEMKPIKTVLPDSLQPGYDPNAEGVIPGAELDMAARSVIDSTYIVDIPQDTASVEEEEYMISKDKEVRVLKYISPDSVFYDPNTSKYVPRTPKYVIEEKRYNVDQDNYMWYLRHYLVLPDVKLANQQQLEAAKEAGKKAKKGGFFKNLFKKKKKAASDSASLQTPVKADDDFDFIDEADEGRDVETSATEIPTKKKGFFSFLSKKDKPAKAPKEPKEKRVKEKKEKKGKEEAADEKKPDDDDDDGF